MIKTKFKIWYEKDGKMVFGKGRACLLEKIEKLGSLNKAAEDLGMSYRAAWGKLKATEENLGEKLVEMSPTGAILTKKGREWVNRYNFLEKKLEKEIVS